MVKDRPGALPYALAVATIVVWSSTFIATKVLLSAFTPMEVLFYRFFLAWVFMFALYPRVHRPESAKSELLIALAGVAGGSLYFIAENVALSLSLASNVSLLVSTAPILTAVLAARFVPGERLERRFALGALVAFAGAILVILNGKFVLRLNPAGDILALSSSLSWAVYCVIIRRLKTSQNEFYVTRKIFFYTLVTALPALALSPLRMDFSPLRDPTMVICLAFLTLFASCAAYLSWNRVIRAFGPTKANAFIYFIPLLTLIESAIFIGEPLTPFALAGGLLIFAGVWVGSRAKKQ